MIKSNKGIALASLVVTVIIMITITGTIAYTSLDTIKLRKLDNMYSDIRLLNQKVTNYHIENDELPILGNAIHKNVIAIPDEILNPNDGPYYYLIDLEKLNGVSLALGKKYNVDNILDDEKKDAYIINEATHTIYYLQGIEFELEDGTEVLRYTVEEAFSALGYGSIPIPEGFYYVGGNIKTGFVISDNEDDENKGADYENLLGNQFVWIPVNNYDDFKRYNWPSWDETTKPTEISSEYTEDTKELEKSVKLFGGFYLGRYEAGYVNEQTVSKNVEAHQATTFSDAQTKAESMYQDDNTKKVVSTLCYGAQWDAAMTYLSDFKVEETSYITYTGQRETDVAKNIYNMHRGVVREWTMESHGENQVIRGTAKSMNPDIETATVRNESATPTGFRVALYIKHDV